MGHEVLVNVLPYIASVVLTINTTYTPATTLPSPQENKPAKHYVAWDVQRGEKIKGAVKRHYGISAYWSILWDTSWVETQQTTRKKYIKLLALANEKKKVARPKFRPLQVAYTSPPSSSSVSAVHQVAQTRPVAQQNAFRPSSFDDVYKEAGVKYGVPWEILYGLHLTETGLRDGTIYNHQGTGAQGPMQFMPGTWRAYGVDGNGDGVADINNAVDAIHGAANFLAKHGSLANGLRFYGGNTSGVYSAARSRGFTY